ncbi:MAG: hypothetical protein R3B72_38365 [Polyangiaceae bacterium]
MRGEATLEPVEPRVGPLEELADARGLVGLLDLLGLHELFRLAVELGQLVQGAILLGVLDSIHHDDTT